MNKSAATMANYGEDIDNIDFGMLVMDKEVVDDDEEEQERLIKANCLYEDGQQAKVGSSGASMRTGALGASSVMSGARSTSSANVRHGYRVESLDLAKDRGKNAALEAALRAVGIDPDNIAGVRKRSENVESGSPDDDSESEVNRLRSQSQEEPRRQSILQEKLRNVVSSSKNC